jgi:hypothetical protein
MQKGTLLHLKPIHLTLIKCPLIIYGISQALGGVWVNIWQFLDAKEKGKPVRKFASEAALASWTIKKRKIFPKEKAKQGGPARALLAHIFR